MINALLVRWNGGWSHVVDGDSAAAWGRREALLGLGATQSRPEMERIASAQLDIYANPRTQITVDPVVQDMTYASVPRLGDTVTVPALDGTPTQHRVLQRTFAEDDNGTVTMALDIADVHRTREQRWEETLKKMADGTLRGDSKVATPVAQVGGAPPACCVPQPPGGGDG